MKEIRLSRKHRAERRKAIATLVKNGLTSEAASELFGVAPMTVYAACREHGVKTRVPPTPHRTKCHAERAALRGEMAALVKSGQTIAAAAERFGVTPSLVYRACKEHSVQLPNRCSLASRTYAVIADLINTDTPQSVLAKKYGLSSQRIAQIYDECRCASIIMPKRKKRYEEKCIGPCEEC